MGRKSNARERLIETGATLMHQRGYTAVGVGEICAEAGVNKGSFYYFFPSKQELAAAVIEEYERQHRPLLEALLDRGSPPLDRIRAFFEESYRNQQGKKKECGRMLGCPFGNLALEMSTQDDTLRLLLKERFDRFADAFERAIEEAVAAGDLPDQDAGEGARSLLALLQGSLMMAKIGDDPEVLRELAGRALGLIRAEVA